MTDATSAFVLSGAAPLGEEPRDLYVADGVLVDDEPSGATRIAASGLVALPGLVDLHTHLREPGREDAETVLTGSRAAALGGFTAVLAMANTSPVTDTAEAAERVYDLGRAAEFDDPLTLQPTVPGRLLGHLFLGRDLVRDAARDVPDLNPQLLQLLEHVIVSHLNLPEWGSPRLPLVPESLILHHADDLDAKFEMYARCLTRDTADGPFTNRDPVLGRLLLKARKV